MNTSVGRLMLDLFTTDYTDFHRLFLFLANGFFTTEDTEFHRDLFLIRTENFKELRVTLCYSVVNKIKQTETNRNTHPVP